MKYIYKIMGVLLLIVAMVLIFWSSIEEYLVKEFNDKVIEAHADDKDVEVTMIESFILDEPEIERDDVSGYLDIPSVEIREPIYYGPVTEENLRNGVSLINESDSLDMQNISIAGHRVEGVGIRFNNLGQLEIGDDIILSSKMDKKHFKVIDIFEVDPSQVDVMDQNEGNRQELTLITCEDYNPATLLFEKRLIIKAELI